MSTTRDKSGQVPLKTAKITPKEKSGDALTTSLRASLAIILTFSISLAVYSTLHTTIRPAFFGWSQLPDPAVYMARLNSDQSPTNISHLAFGIGGSTRTWETRRLYSDLWWRPNVTRGFVFLERNPDPEIRSAIPHRVSSDWGRYRRSAGSESAVRISRVVVDLFRVGLPNVRWFVMGDDDTVFFPDNLVAVLGKYDHRRMVYVGGNSESVEQDLMHAYDMAFGGGGFAISYPLAAQLVGKMDGCLNRYHYFYGSDQRVWACVGELGVGLSRESGFHQEDACLVFKRGVLSHGSATYPSMLIDIRGNPFGLLAAHPLAPLVSLHHLDYVDPLFPNRTQLDSVKALKTAHMLDPSRTLQQCFCYHHKNKWSVSISWGYAVQIYPEKLTAKELETPLLTFRTWRTWEDGPFTFNTRLMNPDQCRNPIVLYLDLAGEGLVNDTVTAYRKPVEETTQDCGRHYARAAAVENVVVLAPKMDPHEWNQGPRRQCCEIKGGVRHGTMRIQIRKCRDSETITI
ncbi:hypothetical protein STAS_11194 [Striga asiatica]|uniref:Uncharacterized protein n=2 Tax=Striga asiatica TaxID=4170 RepID=A0A5A7PPS7_STRAF|nr:hypothetical protein STAS_11194 [Striga asiatica]